MMFLSDIHIVDLNRSDWDKTKSNPKKGKYKFNKKVYTTARMADTTKGLNGYKFKWNRNDPRAISDWQIKWNFSLVTVKDPYWPEGVDPDGEGKYVYKTDMVLMKISIANYSKKRMREIAKAERASDSVKAKFRAECQQHGIQVSDDQLEQFRKELGIKK